LFDLAGALANLSSEVLDTPHSTSVRSAMTATARAAKVKPTRRADLFTKYTLAKE
jgi:hypothetical protein